MSMTQQTVAPQSKKAQMRKKIQSRRAKISLTGSIILLTSSEAQARETWKKTTTMRKMIRFNSQIKTFSTSRDSLSRNYLSDQPGSHTRKRLRQAVRMLKLAVSSLASLSSLIFRIVAS